MQSRIRKAAKYIAVPAMLLSSGIAFNTQGLFAANQDTDTAGRFAQHRASPGTFVSPGQTATGGPSVTKATSLMAPSANSPKSVLSSEQAKEFSSEVI
jgi:hypothetical protein